MDRRGEEMGAPKENAYHASIRLNTAKAQSISYTNRRLHHQSRKYAVACRALQRNNWLFNVVVLEESTSFKNSQSKRFKSLKLLRSRIHRFVELTGIPASNGLENLWAQIYLIDGGARLRKTLGAYCNKYFVPGKRNRTTIFSYTPKDGSLEMIRQAIGGIVLA